MRREDAEHFTEEVRGDDPEMRRSRGSMITTPQARLKYDRVLGGS